MTREGCVPGPQYHNPDPLIRLIGTPNESPAIMEGVPITSLIDSGANMSAITKSFAEELQLEIKGLQMILDIEVTGGGQVPYHGYVECRLTLPDIEKFDLDVLMLVVDDSPYGMRVPIQIGTLHIDMALDLATEEEKRKLNCQWRRAELAASLHMKSANAKAEDSEESQPTFDLAQISGSVHLIQDLALLPFKDVTLKGLLKGHVKQCGYFKRVNVALEPLEQHKEGEGTFCAVPTYTFLKPGSNCVEVMLKNITARPIMIKQGIKVAVIEAANAVPKMLAPKQIGEGMEAVSKSAQGGINNRNPNTHSSEPEVKSKTEVD